MTATDLSALLDELGRRLGPAGSHVFDLAVRQQLISGGVQVFVGLVILIGGVLAHRLYVKNAKDNGNKPDGFEWGITVFTLVFGLFFFLMGLMTVLNPEWYAISAILNQVKR